MKSILTFLISIIVFSVITSCDKLGTSYKQKLKNETDSLSYYIGIITGLKLKDAGYKEFNKELFEQAILKTFNPKDTNDGEFFDASNIINHYIKIGLEKKYAITLNEGREFLSKNKTRKEVKVTSSGLQYEIIKEGNGIKPNLNDSVKVRFLGVTIDGKIFINSDQYAYPGGQLWIIPGCREGLQLMKSGSIYKFYLPTELAYGREPVPGDIVKINMAVIFEIELFSVVPRKHGSQARKS